MNSNLLFTYHGLTAIIKIIQACPSCQRYIKCTNKVDKFRGLQLFKTLIFSKNLTYHESIRWHVSTVVNYLRCSFVYVFCIQMFVQDNTRLLLFPTVCIQALFLGPVNICPLIIFFHKHIRGLAGMSEILLFAFQLHDNFILWQIVESDDHILWGIHRSFDIQYSLMSFTKIIPFEKVFLLDFIFLSFYDIPLSSNNLWGPVTKCYFNISIFRSFVSQTAALSLPAW